MSTPNRTWFAVLSTLVLGGAGITSAGCNTLECAEGTVEQNGACVPADEVVDEANCGEGTLLGPDGVCVPEFPPTECDLLTTTPDTTTIPGVVLCVGTGGATCDTDFTCPQADANKVSVCGRLYDVQTDAQLRAVAPNIADCDNGGATDGPCELEITFYDALEFAGDPGGATPIVPQQFRLDDCGRFLAHNLNRPQLGFLGIGVDDAAAGGTKELTGVAFPVSSAQVRNRQKTYVVTSDTNTLWTGQAGGLGGMSFVERGAFMTVFSIGGVPEDGVQITEGGTVEAANDYYFDDASTVTRASLNPALTSSGMNGAGIKINSALVEHSGTGGALPTDCTWESALAAAIPGVLFFSPRAAVSGGQECE